MHQLIQYSALPDTVHGSLGCAQQRSQPVQSTRQQRVWAEIGGRSTRDGIAEPVNPIKSGMAGTK
ncbi:MAG TPA: hypothetical protein VMV87_06055 [Burkholderiales bacterium]|nr:hypothetical protein [Burkholderiales bacterium]